MHCRVCNTRLGSQESHCPNCGNAVRPGAPAAEAAPRPAARLPDPRPLVPAREPAVEDREAEAALEKIGLGASERPAQPLPRRRPGRAEAGMPDRAGLREILARRPGALDSGLSIVGDEAGRPIGVGYATGVGEIDLLAQDGAGAFVVVLVGEKQGAEELVSEVLRRMGWVRKHLGGGTARVRGVVLVDEPPESLSYAAAAVADSVAFMTYRVSLSFEPIEI